MDSQLKKGLLEICVLAALAKQDSYQIIKDVSQVIEISESTLYPILKRLETSHDLETYSVEHNSRLRKYYRLTDSGRRHITDFLDDWKAVVAVIDFIKGEVHYD